MSFNAMATKKPAPKKKSVKAPAVVAKAATTNKQAELQKQIDALQAQMEALNQEAAQELKQKIADARKVVQDLEAELASITSKSAAFAKKQRTRRLNISDEDLQQQILAAMNKQGKDGLNAKQLAKLVSQDPLKVRKFISVDAKVLKCVGNGLGTKFHLP